MDDFLQKPLIFLDLETTDNKISTAMIAEIALIKLDDKGDIESVYHQYFNPTVPMSPEATAVNKLTDEFLKDFAPFTTHAEGILDFIKGCDLAGHNIIVFDIPVLVEEFLRCGKEFPELGVQFVDTMAIQTKIMPRTLAFCYKFFTGQELDPELLHGAKNDAIASSKIYQHQIRQYGSQLGENRADLHKISTFGKTIVDFAGKLTLNDKSQIVYAFGKNINKRVSGDPGYVAWMMGGDFTNDTKRWLKHALRFQDEYYVSDRVRAEVEAKEAEMEARRKALLSQTPSIDFKPKSENPIAPKIGEWDMTSEPVKTIIGNVPSELFPPS
jgi:DNA polymerase-3 subunit epsilon